MEFFLNKVSQQAVTFAIRSGISITSGYAIKQCSHYISSVKGQDRRELRALQERLETKIRIISPAIDLVEIISARGNTSLESALTLVKSLRDEIQALGVRLAGLSSDQGKPRRSQEEVKAVVGDIKRLLEKIEDSVPFINLAITTSGTKISSTIPHNVSPTRLLQASTLLTAGDTVYCGNPFAPAQIGTTFTLSLYMLFASHSHRQEYVSAQDLTWQEVISKCRVKLQRVPLFYEENDVPGYHARAQSKTEEYCYELCLIEDLDDGRVHDTDSTHVPRSFEDVRHAGIIARVPVHQISKMFYTTSGKILGIEESNSPILLIKRDKNAPAPRRLLDRAQRAEYSDDEDEDDYDSQNQLQLREELERADSEEIALPSPSQETDLPRHLDQEWLAFEVFTEAADDDSDAASQVSEATSGTIPASSPPLAATDASALSSEMERLDLNHPIRQTQSVAATKGTLSILECLLRLSILQNYQQTSHLMVHDELLNLFLSDSVWSGSREQREVERDQAKHKIGFDPFGTPGSRSSSSRRHLKGKHSSTVGTPPKPKGTLHLTGAKTPQTLRNGEDLEPGLPPMLTSTPLEDARQKRAEAWSPERQLSSEWTTSDGSYVGDSPTKDAKSEA